MDCAWQVEIDDYCRKVLAKHWPDVPKFGDIKECGAHNLAKVDVIAGGFPCQDISFAGKGAGIDGERSGLWSEYYRIICELRPRYVIVENVSALLVRGIERVLGDLAEGGYDATWDCIPAAAVGAPHRRDRVFIVAYAQGEPSNGLNDNPREREQPRTGEEFGNGCGEDYVAHPNQPGLEIRFDQERLRQFQATVGKSQWAVEPDVGRVANGISRRVDRLKGLGNAVVPQVAEFIGRLIIDG